MNTCCALFLAVLSIWDYPARQPQHEHLRRQFLVAMREGDTETMIETCEKGVKLLPDDPTWCYNLACSLAYKKRPSDALDALERAIDLGFRDANVIEHDNDLRRLSGETRFQELVEYARQMAGRPILVGPLATVPATGTFGKSVMLGEQNVGWDFDAGCFVARLQLSGGSGKSVGDLYMNRDAAHSVVKVADFPGLTQVRLDAEARQRGMDLDAPNMLFPYPVFGNASRAMMDPVMWRSNPRAMMTMYASNMKAYEKMYLSNQIWAFPAHQDCPPVGKYGDVFGSVTPFWLVTAGSSWTDRPYLNAALEASRTLPPATKQAVVSQGLLAPTVMTLLRKSLKGVTNEVEYLTGKAHPTALPPGGVDVTRLRRLAAALKPEQVPPVVSLGIGMAPTVDKPVVPEPVYLTAHASAFVLRSEDTERKFMVSARGAKEYVFVFTHDGGRAARLEKRRENVAEIFLDRTRMSVTNRVDLAVFGRNEGTGWGAPSFVSFAVVDPDAPYSDPLLTRLRQPEGNAKP